MKRTMQRGVFALTTAADTFNPVIVDFYREVGYLPEAVVNYLYLLGWSPKANREVMPLEEVIKMFDLPQILRHNARFDINKLHWLNGEYIKLMSQERFNGFATRALERDGIRVESNDRKYINSAFSTVKEKVKRSTPAGGRPGPGRVRKWFKIS